MGEQYSFGAFSFDTARGELTRGGTPVPLGQRAVALLAVLLAADGRPVTKSGLMEAAWPGTVVEDVNLSVQIAALRKALGESPDGGEWITTVPRVGYRLLRRPSTSTATEPRPEPAGPAAIAVLPFENLGDDREQVYFADGLVGDLITALSRFHAFAVVSRSSSFVYKDRPVDVREAARELGVRYILEGSVRRAGDRFRLNAQLVEGATGRHLWAERFEGSLDAIFDVQDRITEAVVLVVEPKIRQAEIERARAKRPEHLGAYDLYLRSLPYFYGSARDGHAAAIELLERAVALDPGFGPAIAYAAWAYEKRYTAGFADLHDNPRRGIDLARQGLRVAGDDPLVRIICSFVLMLLNGEHDNAITAATEVLGANPNSIVILNMSALIHHMAGDMDIAMSAFHRALELSPGAPEVYEFYTGIGFMHLFRGEYETGLTWIKRAEATAVEWQPIYWALAAAWVHLGNMEEAQRAIAKLRELLPGVTVARLRELTRHMGSERLERVVVDALARAGLPES